MVLQAINKAFSMYPRSVFGHSKHLFKRRTSMTPVLSVLKFMSEIIPQIAYASSQARQHLGHTVEGKGNRFSREHSGGFEVLPEFFIPCHSIP